MQLGSGRILPGSHSHRNNHGIAHHFFACYIISIHLHITSLFIYITCIASHITSHNLLHHITSYCIITPCMSYSTLTTGSDLCIGRYIFYDYWITYCISKRTILSRRHYDGVSSVFPSVIDLFYLSSSSGFDCLC